jgi:hypothetical protein
MVFGVWGVNMALIISSCVSQASAIKSTQITNTGVLIQEAASIWIHTIHPLKLTLRCGCDVLAIMIPEVAAGKVVWDECFEGGVPPAQSPFQLLQIQIGTRIHRVRNTRDVYRSALVHVGRRCSG